MEQDLHFLGQTPKQLIEKQNSKSSTTKNNYKSSVGRGGGAQCQVDSNIYYPQQMSTIKKCKTSKAQQHPKKATNCSEESILYASKHVKGAQRATGLVGSIDGSACN